MATRLAEGIVGAGGRIGWPVDGTEVFAILPQPTLARLRDAGAKFYDWGSAGDGEEPGPDEGMIRLVTSFATKEEEVDAFVAGLSTA
jgi:threonine aldolase